MVGGEGEAAVHVPGVYVQSEATVHVWEGEALSDGAVRRLENGPWRLCMEARRQSCVEFRSLKGVSESRRKAERYNSNIRYISCFLLYPTVKNI